MADFEKILTTLFTLHMDFINKVKCFIEEWFGLLQSLFFTKD